MPTSSIVPADNLTPERARQSQADPQAAADPSRPLRNLQPVTKHDLKQLRKLVADIPSALELERDAESAFQSGKLEEVVELVDKMRAEFRKKHDLHLNSSVSRSGGTARAEQLQRELRREKTKLSLEQFEKLATSLKEMVGAREEATTQPLAESQESAGTHATDEEENGAAGGSAEANGGQSSHPQQAADKTFEQLRAKFTLLQQALVVVKLEFKGQVARSFEDVAKQVERISELLHPKRPHVVEEPLARVKDQRNVFSARVLWWLHLFRNVDAADSHVPEDEKPQLRKERDTGKGPADIASKCFDNLIAALEQVHAGLDVSDQAGSTDGRQQQQPTRPQPASELSEDFLSDFEFADNLAAKRRVVQRTFLTEPFHIEITGSEGSKRAKLVPVPSPGTFFFLEDEAHCQVFEILGTLTRQGLPVRPRGSGESKNMSQQTFVDCVQKGMVHLLLRRDGT